MRVRFGVQKYTNTMKMIKTILPKEYMAVSGEKQEGLGQAGARRGRRGGYTLEQ